MSLLAVGNGAVAVVVAQPESRSSEIVIIDTVFIFRISLIHFLNLSTYLETMDSTIMNDPFCFAGM